ncbi:MAG: type III secretion system export apparatus subunit SctV [Bradymonadales bacterium]|nr:type III secretion system export apparatus subunit SctV [Bradymonadales bacterium]
MSVMVRLLDRYSDIALALLVVGIVGMLVIPLPTALVDILLTANIALAVILLLTSTYVPNVLRITSFPAILLLTTLFRLALNVSTTRLILLQAFAGEVIESFGTFVVKGNYVVGAVIFLILTIIQFVVIARGSERVAEVAARFTLDALPGKQMAIDADLRSGSIDLAEAGRRRAMLQRESRLYGAMDGAMKFVKGDAIAGIIITLVNIIGGLSIGVLQQGLSLGQAARIYTLLTIGDGLVTQIPSILVATTAGIVVTRVTSDEERSNLGREISAQLLEHPKAIALTAGLLCLFAVIPGMPTVPFLLLAIFIGVLAHSLWRQRGVETGATDTEATGPEQVPAEPHCPLAIRLGADLAAHLSQRSGENELKQAVTLMRQSIGRQFGVRIPPLHITPASRPMDGWSYQIELDEVPADPIRLRPDSLLVEATIEQLQIRGIPSEQAAHPIAPDGCAWVPEAQRDRLDELGLKSWTITEVLMLHLAHEVRENLHLFVGLQEVQVMLDELERTHPALVKAVAGKLVNLALLTDVLKRLVEEGISIRNLKRILETIAESGTKARNPVELTEIARSGLKREISHRYCTEPGELQVLLLDPPVEEMIRSSIRQTDSGPVLSLDPAISKEILEAMARCVSSVQQAKIGTVLLTQADIRRYVKKLADLAVPRVAVLSYQELLPSLQIRPVGQVSVGRPRT